MKNKKTNIFFAVIIIFLSLFLFFSKDKLSCFITNYRLEHLEITISETDSLEFFNQFKNIGNSKEFNLSLISLGGLGCKPCMKMDSVLIDIANEYKEKIKIKKYIVTKKEERKIAKYFGISAIPTQIIINKQGVEIFRHTGFIGKKELNKIIKQNLVE